LGGGSTLPRASSVASSSSAVSSSDQMDTLSRTKRQRRARLEHALLVFSLYDTWHGHPARDVHGQDGHATPSVVPWRQHIGCARRKQPVMGFFRAVSARVSIRPPEDGSPDPSVAGPGGRRIPLFPARSREPVAGSQETVASGEWLVVSNRWRVTSREHEPRVPFPVLGPLAVPPALPRFVYRWKCGGG